MNSVRFLFKDGKSKALTMSYDDGVVQDKRLIEIFNKHGIKGSFHINGGLFDAPGRCSKEEIKEVYTGHEVSCHGYTHPWLERLAQMEVVNEILADKKALEDACGYIVRGMSYPFGTNSEQVVSILSVLGMNYSRTTVSSGNFNPPENFLRWNPTCHHNDARLMSLLEAFKKSNSELRIMYVWGHSYEFDNNKNWEIIEKFCEEASGDPSIWYATNIEIFDYVTATRRCELSADRTMLYNPSAISVWVKIDGEVIECKGGTVTKLD
ncbi:MAG: polysaccharide deacetylase family protein [Clostridia bacterium]|nr:polysaccharide deacetylase family protein [Clostridia bacterium]